MRAKVNLPKLKNLEKAVGRKRFANGQQVSVPHLISEINIPEQLQRTKTDLNENLFWRYRLLIQLKYETGFDN
uniref:Uncharacterized protein n=1 Tax=Meloidogyne enterolobii TaxID=390850 RepID=A0A6V7V0C1_MELEN|nr:unnamed protein product [Meloidogyne enterolobii]